MAAGRRRRPAVHRRSAPQQSGGSALEDARRRRKAGVTMRWKVHGYKTLYTSDWVGVELADVELPNGRHLKQHVVRMPRESAFTAIVQDQRVLMLWRHRFITNRWG